MARLEDPRDDVSGFRVLTEGQNDVRLQASEQEKSGLPLAKNLSEAFVLQEDLRLRFEVK